MGKIRGLLRGLNQIIIKRKARPFAISIDVTYRCNLKCEHCYFKKENYHNELSINEWRERIKRITNDFDLFHCTWVGGEPLLRFELIKEGRKFFDFNWIVSNGTLEIPNLRDCNFYISIDGTKKYHELIRGKKSYDKTKENILSSNAKIFLAMVINQKNFCSLSDLIKEWSNTNIEGINFDFYTPLRKKDNLFIHPNKRDELLDEIKKLKDDYGDFILISDEIIEAMKSYNYKKVIGKNCLVRKCAICLDPEGKIKVPCVMGKVECSNCGCIIPYFLYSFFKNDWETITATVIIKKIL